jgi:glyoxylase-like metal-dependent hydrolase (beta-lactamase superfamily II)
MTEVKVLVQGYARECEGHEEATSSAVLIEDSGKKIVVDPGADKDLLLEALEKEGLATKDIDLIFLTHKHMDHILNIRLFPGTIIVDGNEIYDGNKITEYEGNIPGTSIQVIQTPGHTYSQSTLIVKTKEGVIAIAEDLFWWSDGEEQKVDLENLLGLKDIYAKDENKLKESRKLILAKADFIIPGHGKMFKVEK